MQDNALLAEQLEYYRARAAEYDEWFFRRGRYDRGELHRAQWLREADVVESALQKAAPPGHILELACGAGLWTRHLAKTHVHVTAVDAAPEVIAINRARVASNRVEYVVADLFSWAPAGAVCDLVFFGFWLSHVPDERFDQFWQLVHGALRPGGAAFFVDSLREQTSTAVDHGVFDNSGVVTRVLNDGRSFRIVKVFYEPETLQRRLARLGWKGAVQTTGKFFLYGLVAPGGQAGRHPRPADGA
jgi:demethylmenaquinone methyltransferase/2-methoxy-6-polyprenyl-1,4-benzoquinol methylase